MVSPTDGGKLTKFELLKKELMNHSHRDSHVSQISNPIHDAKVNITHCYHLNPVKRRVKTMLKKKI